MQICWDFIDVTMAFEDANLKLLVSATDEAEFRIWNRVWFWNWILAGIWSWYLMLLKISYFGERILGSFCLLFAYKTREILFPFMNHLLHHQQHDHDSMIVHWVFVILSLWVKWHIIKCHGQLMTKDGMSCGNWKISRQHIFLNTDNQASKDMSPWYVKKLIDVLQI